MPANLPAEAKHKWSEVSSARTDQQKLQLLQEFLSLVPKHKGTGRLCAQVKRQMATLRKEIAEKKQRRVGKGGPKFFIEKEGAAQIVVLGMTNVGKSSLLASTTNAKAEVSSYSYTTRQPVPGIFQYEDIQFQIIEAPALMEGSAKGEACGLQTLALARNADGLILMADLSQNPTKQFSLILSELEKARILINKPLARVDIERKHAGAGLKIITLGQLVNCTTNDVENLLKSYRIYAATVKIFGDATLGNIEDAIFENTIYRPAVVVANKADNPEAVKKLAELKKMVGEQIRVLSISCKTQTGLEFLGRELFESLNLIRIYTRDPSKKEPSKKPFILKRSAKILDLAKQIHSDFHKQFSYSKVWSKHSEKGKSTDMKRGLRYNGQKVGLKFPLEDGDIVEIHTK